MKTKLIKIAASLLLAYSAIGLAYEFLYSWNMYDGLLNIGGPRVSQHYISGPLWKELFINLATPAFACSLAFYLLKERFHEKKRQFIKYGFYATSIWMVATITFVALGIFLNRNI
jgi:hypothetical protein